jgi:hypothetical protein
MLKYRMALIGVAVLALWPSAVAADDLAWELWLPIPGVLDIDGPRSDGMFVVVGSAELWLLDPSGQTTPFARGPGGYQEDRGRETYLAMSPAMEVDGADCGWVADETYLLRLHTPFGVNRVNADGTESGSFVNTPGVQYLTAITFDTEGTFKHRMLVLGIAGTRSLVFAIDCNGRVEVVARNLPALEGQMAVAPASFGAFAGNLIIPDETGRILAVAPDGKLAVVMAAPPAGVDRRIGALSFVPEGFTERGGDMYHADQKTPGSAVVGTDTMLRIQGEQLIAAGVRDGDLLATAEIGGALLDVRCADSCTVTKLIGNGKSHAEGHFAFALNPPAVPPPSPAPPTVSSPLLAQPVMDLLGMWGLPAGVFVLLVAFLGAVALQAMRQRAP